MSEKINDGGPFHPVAKFDLGSDPASAMSLEIGCSMRDAFAMATLQGLCANAGWLKATANVAGSENVLEAVAWHCYEQADAMIKARGLK